MRESFVRCEGGSRSASLPQREATARLSAPPCRAPAARLNTSPRRGWAGADTSLRPYVSAFTATGMALRWQTYCSHRDPRSRRHGQVSLSRLRGPILVRD
jgi:hypothetical protein